MFSIFLYFIFFCFSLSPKHNIFTNYSGNLYNDPNNIYFPLLLHPPFHLCLLLKKNNQVQLVLPISSLEHGKFPVDSPLQKIEFSLALQPARNHPLHCF